MRLLLATLAVLMLMSIAACSGQGTVSTNAALNTLTPTLSTTPIVLPVEFPTDDSLVGIQATMTANPVPTNLSPRAGAATRTPAPNLVPAPTRTDDLPLPMDAHSTRNIPANLRDFVNTQLKGQRRISQPTAYVSMHPRAQVLAKYTSDLQSQGWDSIPLGTNLPDNTSILIAQKDIHALIAFLSESDEQTLVYIVTTLK